MELQLIKGGEAYPIDAERIVPGRVVALRKTNMLTHTFFRIGDRYYERVAYSDAGCAANCIRDNMNIWTEINRGEWAHLQDVAGQKGAAAQEPENAAEPKPLKPSAKRHKIYGHRWEAQEFLHELRDLVEAGEVLIAHDSQFNTSFYCTWDYEAPKGCWKHFAFFRTLEFSLLGNRRFRLVAIHEALPERYEEWVTKQTAKCRYRNLPVKLEPLGPLTREEELPRESGR